MDMCSVYEAVKAIKPYAYRVCSVFIVRAFIE